MLLAIDTAALNLPIDLVVMSSDFLERVPAGHGLEVVPPKLAYRYSRQSEVRSSLFG
jgi:hypothetical protein